MIWRSGMFFQSTLSGEQNSFLLSCNKQTVYYNAMLGTGQVLFSFKSPWLQRTVLWEKAIVFIVIWWWNVMWLKYFCNKLFHPIKAHVVWSVGLKRNLHYNALRNPWWKTYVRIRSYQHIHKCACFCSPFFSLPT